MQSDATPPGAEDEHEALPDPTAAPLSEAVMILDLRWRVKAVTQAACRMLGRSEPEFQRPEWWSMFDARSQEGMVVGGHRSLGARVIATRQLLRAQTIDVARRDGTRMWLSVDYRPLTSADGDITGLLLSMRDITHLPG